MKKIILLLIAVSCFGLIDNCFSQPAIQWEKCLGGSGEDDGSAICQTNDGGYLVVGFSSSHNGNLDSSNHGGAWIIKLDNNGAIQWEKSYGGTSYGDYLASIAQTSDGGYILAGETDSNNGDITGNHGGNDAWVLKLNNIGAVQWSKCYGGTGEDDASSILQTTDGGYIFVGGTISNNGDVIGNHGNYDAWVVKLNDTGAIEWSRCYGGSNGDVGNVIAKTQDGGYVIAANSLSTDGDATGNLYAANGAGWVIKLDIAGTIQWQKCYGGYNGGMNGYSIITTTGGGYLLGGNTSATNGDILGNHGGIDYYVIKLTDTGDIQWQKCYGGSGNDYGYSIVNAIDGTYAIGGYSNSTDGQVTGNHGGSDYWVVKLDTNGTLIWEKSYGSSFDDWAYSMVATSDNGIALTGSTNGHDNDVTGYHGGLFDYWVVKLAPDSMVGIDEVQNKEGIRVYPNPANNILNIQLSSIINKEELFITDVLGNSVYHQTLNNLTTNIDVSGFSNGVYFYQITNNKETYRGKFVVEK